VHVAAPGLVSGELGHVTHVAELVAAVLIENVPAAQSVHTAALPLAPVWYLPATHAEHVPPFAPVNPALHEQTATSVLETGAFAFEGQAMQVDKTLAPTAAEYVAVPQSVHAALPTLVLYLPATHREHETTGPVLPAGQSKKHAVLPACENPPTAHEVHVLAPFCDAVKVPAAQSVQVPLALYLPAAHRTTQVESP
jgi:hypothetical protein